jgi:serine/threonine protein kinase
MTKCPTCGFANAAGARLCAHCGYEFTLSLEPPADQSSLFLSEIDPIREKLVEKYQILRFLGKGGFATVFLIRDKALDRLCALKILAHEQTLNPESVERFKREARLYASLDHPHIVAVYDFGIHNHVAYMIFKYIDGITLHEHVKRRHPLAQAEIISIASDLADILGYMHQRGIIHRDLKPDNVMIQNGDRKVILTDFGLAKKLDTTTVTSDGKVMGSPHYFSPEQAKGEPVDARSDIYSLGITIYEMLSGIVPFMGDTPYEVILKHIREPIPDSARLRPDLPPELHRLVRRCTEKEPKRRFQTAQELKAALLRVPATAPAEMTTQVIRRGHPRRWGLRRLIGVSVAAAALAGVLVGAYLFLNRQRSKALEPPHPEWNLIRNQSPANAATPGETFASLLREAQEALSRGDFAVAREKAAAARALKAGKEVDELDGLIRARYEAEMKKPVYLADRREEKPKPATSPGISAGKKPDSRGAIPPPEKKREPMAQKQPLRESGSGQDEATEEPEAAPVQAGAAEKPAAVRTGRIMDLPGPLVQKYVKELTTIYTVAVEGELRVSGTVTLVLGIDEAGNIGVESLNDVSLKIDPESRRSEALRLVRSRLAGIRLPPPIDKAGNSVRVENWRITFHLVRERQMLVLVRVS